MPLTIAVLSYKKLTDEIRKLNLVAPDPIKIRIVDILLEEELEKVIEMERNNEVDVFVSAGSNAKVLTNHIKSPFVEIKITGFDLLRALKSASRNSRRAAIITYLEKIPYLADVKDILSMDIKEITYNHGAEIDLILDELKSEGIYDVVGGSLVSERTEEKGMFPHFIYSADGITRAMDTAIKIALSERAQVEKAEELRAILNFVHEGILAVDEKGVIKIFTPNAERITGVLRAEAIGRSLEQVIPHSKLNRLMETGQPQLDHIETVGSTKILINWVPIVIKGQITGAVATIQDIGAIQASEKKIRLNLHRKGLVARTTLDEIIGNSPAFIRTKRQADLFAKKDSTVLIYGDSGTGKELFAQGIHNASIRSRGPFVALNCAALPENLLESELFGYEEGAFTGARRGGKQGLFELAHGGTIFLDEIGEISLPLQARLLRVIETREVMRLGGESITPIDIRIIAATNKDLWGLVQQGRFREDLYYRLCVLELRLPTLSERQDDIPLLFGWFLQERRPDLESDEIRLIAGHPLLRSYPWPGNVRELKNFAERFAVLYDGQQDANSLLASMFQNKSHKKVYLEEEDEILHVLKEVRGNKTKAAKKLGISRTTLWRRLKKIRL